MSHTPSSKNCIIELHNGILHFTDGPLNNTWLCINARNSLVLAAKQCCLIRNEQVRTAADAILLSHRSVLAHGNCVSQLVVRETVVL